MFSSHIKIDFVSHYMPNYNSLYFWLCLMWFTSDKEADKITRWIGKWVVKKSKKEKFVLYYNMLFFNYQFVSYGVKIVI